MRVTEFEFFNCHGCGQKISIYSEGYYCKKCAKERGITI